MTRQTQDPASVAPRLVRWTKFLAMLAALPLVVAGCTKSEQNAESAASAEVEVGGAVADPAAWNEHTQGLTFVIGYNQGLEKAKAENKPAMLFVTATWCGWCKKLANESFNDPEVRQLLDKFVLVIVDLDSEGEVAEKLGVQGVPYIVFESPEGKKLSVTEGYKPVPEFKADVEHALEQLGA
jgi:thiol:disulfide interchange protein